MYRIIFNYETVIGRAQGNVTTNLLRTEEIL